MNTMRPYLDDLWSGPIIPRYAKPLVKAEQTKPDSRAARRQAKREKDRKWEIKYAESEGEE